MNEQPIAAPGPEPSTEAMLQAVLGSARQPELSPGFERELLRRIDEKEAQRLAARARKRGVLGILSGYGVLVLAAVIWILLTLRWPEEPSGLIVLLSGGVVFLALAIGAVLVAIGPAAPSTPQGMRLDL